MTPEREKAAARCRDCGRALAVWVSTSGDVAPIGSGAGCPCGGTQFRVL